ncbi:uncharacterized protein LOC135226197 [Macrobrachium nipponense]|uniref:uncharacterized protein LOC135226197 n=1 Tax=Macrobrachium nipponense TaxID=159736 RepID=UPI0030C7DC36
MREKGVSEKYVRIVSDMCREATTQVRSSVGTTEKFEVKVRLYQGSALSPYIFDMVMNVIVAGVKDQVPWSVLCADDIVLVTTSVLCDKRFKVKLKEKMYKSIVRPALMYSSETWPLKKAQERVMEVAEMRMLRLCAGDKKRQDKK